MCLKNTEGRSVVGQSDRKGVRKHYETFGKWKHGYQKQLGKAKKYKKEG